MHRTRCVGPKGMAALLTRLWGAWVQSARPARLQDNAEEGIRRRCRLAMGLTLLLALGWLLPTVAWSAAAIEISPWLERVRQAAARGDYEGSIEALQGALAKLQGEAPLLVKPFVLVSEPAKFYGDYTARKDAIFRRGEQLHFYLEPENLVYPQTAQGIYEPAFSVDFQVLSPDSQQVLAEQERFGFFRIASKSPVHDIFMNLKVTLTGAPAGSYQIKFIVRDGNSEKIATAVQPITLK